MATHCWQRTAALVVVLALAARAEAGVRIKDITDLEGARGNPLLGIGLVTGLKGTGGKGTLTSQTAVDMLARFNINARVVAELRADPVYRPGNVALVVVTAELGAWSRRGSRLDVTVSTLDDSSSLQGGVLLMTPLRGADGVDYAVAQGPLSVGGFVFGGQAATAQQNHPTVGRISGGATVEREARGEIVCNGAIRLLLHTPDPETARGIALVVDRKFPGAPVVLDPGTVQVALPRERYVNPVAFASEVGVLEVNPDVVAKVVINERTGTVVAGENVKISRVLVTHGNLSVITGEEPQVAQPAPFAGGRTAVVPRTQLGVIEETGPVRVLGKTLTVADLARALNALGVTPRDLVAIFQAIKQAGALHAELIFI